jgi:hypothetical protein
MTEAARGVLNTLQEVAQERYVPPYAFALVYAGFGEMNEAFAWLDRAYEARDVHLVFLPVDAKWDAVRDNLRFQELIKRRGFATPAGQALWQA